MKPPAHYHPLLMALHWLLAVLIIAALIIGFFWLAPQPNTDPGKIAILKLHMAGGMAILGLMAVRFVIRLVTAKPLPLTTGYRLLDRLAPVTHYGFYALVLLMAGSGFATALLARLPEIVFAGSGDPLPASFAVYPTWRVHFYGAAVLVALIVLHVVATLYHHFIRRDDVLRRMTFGRRS